MKQISLRINKDLFEKSEELSKLEKLERSVILRQALEKGMEDLTKKTVADLYKKDKISLSEAADLADLGIGELLSFLKEQGVKSKISMEDFEKGEKTAKDLID